MNISVSQGTYPFPTGETLPISGAPTMSPYGDIRDIILLIVGLSPPMPPFRPITLLCGAPDG